MRLLSVADTPWVELPRGFLAALALAAESLIGLALLGGQVTVTHRLAMASEAYYSAGCWPPDQLAGMGVSSSHSCHLGRVVTHCFHLLTWSAVRRSRAGLILAASCRVSDTEAALRWLGFGDLSSLRSTFVHGFLRASC